MTDLTKARAALEKIAALEGPCLNAYEAMTTAREALAAPASNAKEADT